MLKKLYISLFDFGRNGKTQVYEFLEEIIKYTNKIYSNFVIVKTVSENNTKRKIFNSIRKFDIEENKEIRW